jgi:hypothetical protein
LDASADVAALIRATKSLRSSQTDRWLVYDPTDKTAMKIGSEEKVEDDPVAVYATKHLLGHFYLVMRYQ